MAETAKPVPQEDFKAMEKSTEEGGSYPPSPAAYELEADPALDSSVRWRRDLLITPMMGILYMILFLDRTNIANARAIGIGEPNGMEATLDMPSNGYNTALWIFYVPFVLAEIPANLLLNKNFVRPGVFLGCQMFILGIISMCQGLTGSYGGLLACRFLMGIFEAALPAGATYMISLYYTKRESAVRFAWFFNFALAGPLFSGLLAYAIAGLEGVGGLEGWRWIFVIEGLMTTVLAVAVFWVCPNFPSEAQSWFLKPAQRDRLVALLEQSRGREDRGSAADDVSIWKVLVDWRIHLFTMGFFCCDMTAASISSFAPTILTELGWTNTVAQLMTMPVWGAGIVATFGVTWLSQRCNLRTPFVLGSIAAVMAGWIIMVAYVPTAGVRYFSLFLMSMGTFPQMAIFMSWMGQNLRGRRHLAVGTAWMIGFGNCANFVSSNVFITEESPYYPTGFSIGLSLTTLGFVLTACGCAFLLWKNRQTAARRAALATDEERERFDEVHFKYLI